MENFGNWKKDRDPELEFLLSLILILMLSITLVYGYEQFIVIFDVIKEPNYNNNGLKNII